MYQLEGTHATADWGGQLGFRKLVLENVLGEQESKRISDEKVLHTIEASEFDGSLRVVEVQKCTRNKSILPEYSDKLC